VRETIEKQVEIRSGLRLPVAKTATSMIGNRLDRFIRTSANHQSQTIIWQTVELLQRPNQGQPVIYGGKWQRPDSQIRKNCILAHRLILRMQQYFEIDPGLGQTGDGRLVPGASAVPIR
jgi:hypothetical protein